MNKILKLIFAIGICEIVGIGGAFFTSPAVSSDWYSSLEKPALNPPSWIFSSVWITLYALMGISVFLIWKQHSNILQNVRMLRVWKIGLAAFFIQLFLNAIWSIIFFGLKNPGWAFVDIILLWLAILGTIIVFYKISRPAAFLLLPYLIWVSFAGYLNYSIWSLNPNHVEPIFCIMDVKECPEGSYVARIPPKCEFAACPETKTVKLYYYNYELDRDESGNSACSRNGLAPVERKIPITKTPIEDTIKVLLLGELTDEERAQGISTEYPLEGLSLKKGTLLKDGVLTLEFDDSKNKTVGGSCRVGILWFQIEATAKQFPEVREVRFLPEEIFQP